MPLKMKIPVNTFQSKKTHCTGLPKKFQKFMEEKLKGFSRNISCSQCVEGVRRNKKSEIKFTTGN